MTPTRDLTSETSAETDVAPIGGGNSKPAHERTVDEDRNVVDWTAVAKSPAFEQLLAAKRRVIVPLTIFFVIYYFALPLSVGFLPEFMNTPVLGNLNLAYVFALSQFVMAWGIAAYYLRVAARWDRMAADIARASQRPVKA
jgi:uncharacterized membrane protein (DUF485 family)